MNTKGAHTAPKWKLNVYSFILADGRPICFISSVLTAVKLTWNRSLKRNHTGWGFTVNHINIERVMGETLRTTPHMPAHGFSLAVNFQNEKRTIDIGAGRDHKVARNFRSRRREVWVSTVGRAAAAARPLARSAEGSSGWLVWEGVALDHLP